MVNWQNLIGLWTKPIAVGAIPGALLAVIFLLFIIWSVVWKGLALWKAARVGSSSWFMALMVINTAGILDILYIYVFSKPAGLSKTDLISTPPATPPAASKQ